MTGAESATRVRAIVPAAGMSRRMGRPKQLLSVGGTTMAARVVAAILDGGADNLVAVTRAELLDRLDLPSDDRIRIAYNEDPDSEMIDSIRIGLRELSRSGWSDADGILVVPADMPLITTESIRACVAAFAADPTRIVVASHNGRRGHPIIFPAALAHAVHGLTGGLRELLDRFPERVAAVAVSDAGATKDVNTPAEYDALPPDGAE